MKAYKVFDSDWRCLDFQYEVGKEYKMKTKSKLCKSGFHACKKLADCFHYYVFNPKNKVAEVELLGDIIGLHDNKQVTNHIKIIRELTWLECLNLVNSGNYNSGYRNSGNYNSGNYNSGYYNSGNYNSDNYNSGNYNSGYRNSGNCNSDNYNSGNCNSGNYNSGNYNSGYCNSGYRNSGYYNSGNCNSGNYNSGNYNSGYYNSGYRNSGYRNSGNYNSGNYNSGNYNSGNYNSGNYNSGVFNTNEPKLRIFNMESSWTITDYHNSILFSLLRELPIFRNLTYKEKFLVWYSKLTIKEKLEIRKLPNFNKKLFFEITGIKYKY